ncbi:MAG: plasmid pRiA4b ORF-3 family protein [Nitrospirae bacterium]|nr:plasmid pRiA4b ORF-3 family protein [Nitrospirota bacterium]
MKRHSYVLKVALADIEPEIWRRFVVPSDITLDRLHDVIQIVMGWTDSHLHEFTIGGKRYSEYLESPEDGKEDGLYRLGNLVKGKVTSFEYIYDFGDTWRHNIILENKDYPLGPHDEPILFLEGERACPPEDVGGIGGYVEFCDAMRESRHPNHRQYTKWYGKKYDPERFDKYCIERDLLKYFRWSRSRFTQWDIWYY